MVTEKSMAGGAFVAITSYRIQIDLYLHVSSAYLV